MAAKKMTPVVETQVVKKVGRDTWTTVGWCFLLLGGLAHMLPSQMAPLLAWSLYGVTVQMLVGIVSVILALYFLLGE